jgi:rhamnose transport system permease protein
VDIIIVGGNQVVASSLPQSFVNIGRSTLLGIPVLAIAVAVVIGAVAYYMRSFRSGRELYAIGSNADAARLAGIPSGRRVFTAFVASGGCAGLAGVIWAIRYGTINSTAGAGLSIEVIAAAVVGGVAAFGGFGSVVGAALGALLLGTIATALSVLGVSPFWIDALSGVLIIGAISLDRGITVRMARVLRTRRFRDEAAEHEGVNT